jgi:hypothetical protein
MNIVKRELQRNRIILSPWAYAVVFLLCNFIIEHQLSRIKNKASLLLRIINKITQALQLNYISIELNYTILRLNYKSIQLNYISIELNYKSIKTKLQKHHN